MKIVLSTTLNMNFCLQITFNLSFFLHEFKLLIKIIVWSLNSLTISMKLFITFLNIQTTIFFSKFKKIKIL